MKLTRGKVAVALVLAVLGLTLVDAAAQGAATRATCSYRHGGALPDPLCTPGATNPSVTQGDIGSTICRPGWTRIVRPSTRVTGPEKGESMRQYAVHGLAPDVFQYDHLIPLELGGAVNDAANLWPQYIDVAVNGRDVGARFKDLVENALHAQVCAGTRTLRSAQREIAHDWLTVLQ